MFASGVLCFLLDENLFTISKTTKVPLYMVLGVSVCFAFTFSALDLINFAVGQLQPQSTRALVDSPVQVRGT